MSQNNQYLHGGDKHGYITCMPTANILIFILLKLLPWEFIQNGEIFINTHSIFELVTGCLRFPYKLEWSQVFHSCHIIWLYFVSLCFAGRVFPCPWMPLLSRQREKSHKQCCSYVPHDMRVCYMQACDVTYLFTSLLNSGHTYNNMNA